MVEVVRGALVIVIHVDGPSAYRNRETKLVLLVAFSAQGNETESLRNRIVEPGAGDRRERRSLVVFAPKAAQHPVQVRDSDCAAHLGLAAFSEIAPVKV
jgi:hypothetical protein